jgi:predicted ArsR family transcriptional regulator
VKALREADAYRALSSKSRQKILRLLHKKPLSVDELAESLDFKPITVRHHLQSLEEAGFIEPCQVRAGIVGRPKIYYRIAKKPKIVGFPKRHYLFLSDLLINTMQFALGANRAERILKRVGMEMGQSTVRKLELKHNIKAWSLKAYEEFFIKKYLEESGAEPEIVKVDDKKIVYRLYNCLFFELAIKMPEMLCDTLHQSFHEGLSKVMGDEVTINRLTCMGRGDPYCEYTCEWRMK